LAIVGGTPAIGNICPFSLFPRQILGWSRYLAPTALTFQVVPDHISQTELVAQLDAALKVPGLSNAWTMPVKGRIDMLTTGVRTPVGLKISGSDVAQIEAIGARAESLLSSVPGARSVFSERTGHGYFLDIEWNREALARYGLSVEEAGVAVENAIGGENIATTVEGRARYPVNVRYLRDFRSDLGALGRVLVPTSNGQRQIPLAEVASIRTTAGPAMIRDENGLLTGYLYVDLEGRDPASYIAEANRLLDKQAGLLPPGYSLAWSGQYEAMARVYERLKIALPLTLILIFFLLYANTRSLTKTLSAPGRSVLRHWRRVVPVPGRIQHERGSMGRVDCAPGSRRRDRSFYVALSRPGLRTGPPDGTADEPGRATRRHPHRGR
jgi:copper/silver efflux system protein